MRHKSEINGKYYWIVGYDDNINNQSPLANEEFSHWIKPPIDYGYKGDTVIIETDIWDWCKECSIGHSIEDTKAFLKHKGFIRGLDMIDSENLKGIKSTINHFWYLKLNNLPV